MNIFTVAILQTIAAIIWIIMLFIARNAKFMLMSWIFTFMAVSSWITIIKNLK